MPALMIRAKVRPEHAADLEREAKAMFAAIEQAHPQGVRYSSFRLPDGASYVILLEFGEGAENPLPGVQAFLSFQDHLRQWLAEPSITEQLSVLGTYRSF